MFSADGEETVKTHINTSFSGLRSVGLIWGLEGMPTNLTTHSWQTTASYLQMDIQTNWQTSCTVQHSTKMKRLKNSCKGCDITKLTQMTTKWIQRLKSDAFCWTVSQRLISEREKEKESRRTELEMKKRLNGLKNLIKLDWNRRNRFQTSVWMCEEICAH